MLAITFSSVNVTNLALFPSLKRIRRKKGLVVLKSKMINHMLISGRLIANDAFKVTRLLSTVSNQPS